MLSHHASGVVIAWDFQVMVNSKHLILSLQPAIYVTSSCSSFFFPVFLNTITYIAVATNFVFLVGSQLVYVVFQNKAFHLQYLFSEANFDLWELMIF
jgi:hypothetical protein